MLAIDTNVLLPAVETSNRNHDQAADFLRTLQGETDVAISELVLIELYGLLRNPQVLAKPASARTAAAICQDRVRLISKVCSPGSIVVSRPEILTEW